jgi:hypothetical protein
MVLGDIQAAFQANVASACLSLSSRVNGWCNGWSIIGQHRAKIGFSSGFKCSQLVKTSNAKCCNFCVIAITGG